jgi:ketosteroid isomerase-like protein
MHPVTALDRFYDALAAGDLDAARACFTPTAQIWHSFDAVAQDVDAAAIGWAALLEASIERGLHDIHRHLTADGLVQQHVFAMRTAAGQRIGWPVCLVVRIENDLITRLDEYIDRAGSFAPPDGPITTPGF